MRLRLHLVDKRVARLVATDAPWLGMPPLSIQSARSHIADARDRWDSWFSVARLSSATVRPIAYGLFSL